jgi:hypothetical protein
MLRIAPCARARAQGDRDFGIWLVAAELAMAMALGVDVSIYDIPDVDWHHRYAAGQTPARAVGQALRAYSGGEAMYGRERLLERQRSLHRQALGGNADAHTTPWTHQERARRLAEAARIRRQIMRIKQYRLRYIPARGWQEPPACSH